MTDKSSVKRRKAKRSGKNAENREAISRSNFEASYIDVKTEH